MEKLLAQVRGHLAAYAVSAAIVMALLRFITPAFVDMLFDGLTVGLVWLTAKLAKA